MPETPTLPPTSADEPLAPDAPGVAQLVVPAPDLDAMVTFFVELGFAVDEVFPADDPATVIMSGHGMCLRLDRDTDAAPPQILLPEHAVSAADLIDGPNGVVVGVATHDADLVMPDPVHSFVLTRPDGDAQLGRAGMHYRDLIPDRQGGRFIASHIRIVEGGPVPDYVHHHHIRFQLIFCHRGWVDVVYEDQGPQFRLEAGDLVLQPPHIRHRVLNSSSGCEVVEIGCPAVHRTIADRTLELPTAHNMPDRDFAGQRFVRHESKASHWAPMSEDWGGWITQDMGVGVATDGLGGARLIRPGTIATQATFTAHDDEFRFHYVRSGTASLLVPSHTETVVGTDDSFVIPPGAPWRLHHVSDDFELFEVRLPAAELT